MARQTPENADETSNEPHGVRTAPDTVRIERLLPGPVERLWQYLTQSEKRRLWLAAGEMELLVGGKVEHVFRHHELSAEPTPARYRNYEDSSMHGEVTRCEPPRILAYSWPEQAGTSEVTFELIPEDAMVRLVVTQRRLSNTDSMISVASGWDAHLNILEDHLLDREPRGFWTSHERLEEAYRQRAGEEAW